MAETVGYAVLQIIPSVRGIGADLRRQLIGPAADAGEQAGEQAGRGFSDRVKDIVTGISIAEGARAIGEQFVEAFSSAIEQGNVKSTLQAQLGTSNGVAAAQGKIAGKLYSSGVSDTFEDAAEAIKSVVQGGLVPPNATNKQLQSIATKASDVANIFGQDMPAVTNAAAQAIRTGLAKNSTEAFDLITKGFQSGANKADDFLDTINEYGTQFRKLGISGPTAVGLINQGLKAGARDSDIVADAIKEFSIRAVDGSTTTQQGFKALGLSAKDITKQIGKGGTSASAGLDKVLDKLRGIKDPVKRSQTAVQLFGTQAEDLGNALFALDPSKAAKGLGNFAGAADKAGKTVRSGPSHELTLFKRTLQQGLVDFLGSKVIPVLSQWGGIFLRDVLPPLTKVGGVLNDAFVPAVTSTVGVISGVVDWFRKWGIFLTPLAILIGGITLALSANAIASGVSAAATATWATVTGIAEAVTGGFATAMGVLNAVMALNPFVLVAIALAALVAGIVIAYKKSATFREIVQAAWNGIKDTALAVVHWFTGTFVPFFTRTIPSVFTGTVNWVKAHWPLILAIITGPIGLATLYVVQHWKQISSGISSAWSAIKSHTLTPIGTFFTKTIPGWAGSLKSKVVGAFKSAATGIGSQWHRIQALTKAPINFVISQVWNKGIVGTWKKIAGWIPGVPALGKLPNFATGGPIHGPGTGTSDSITARLSNGEHVWTAREVNAAGGHQAVAMLRSAVLGGRPVRAASSGPAFKDGGGFLGGLKKLGSKLISATDFLVHPVSSLVNLVAPSLARVGGSFAATPFGKMVSQLPRLAVNGLKSIVSKAAAGLGGKIPTGQHASIISAALSAAGVPPPGTAAQWLSGLNTLIGRESGWNSRAINLTDSNAKAGIPSQGLAQVIPPTFAANVPASLRSRGILDPIANVAAAVRYIVRRYGNITNVQQANASLPPKGYAAGTNSAGRGWAWVGEKGPELMRLSGGERVLSHQASMAAVASQAAAAAAAGTRAAAPQRAADTGGLQAGLPLRLVVDGHEFAAYVDARADGRTNTALQVLTRNLNAGGGN